MSIEYVKLKQLMQENIEIIDKITENGKNLSKSYSFEALQRLLDMNIYDLSPQMLNDILYIFDDIFVLNPVKIYIGFNNTALKDSTNLIKIKDKNIFIRVLNIEFIKITKMAQCEYVIPCDKEQKLVIDTTQLSDSEKKILKSNIKEYIDWSDNHVVCTQIIGTYSNLETKYNQLINEICQNIASEDTMNNIRSNCSLLKRKTTSYFSYSPLPLGKPCDGNIGLSSERLIIVAEEIKITEEIKKSAKDIAQDFVKKYKPENNTSTTAYYNQYVASLSDETKKLAVNSFSAVLKSMYPKIRSKSNGKIRVYTYDNNGAVSKTRAKKTINLESKTKCENKQNVNIISSDAFQDDHDDECNM